MQGLELARAFYTQCGEAMLKREFSAVLDRIAVGLAGQGSECGGYDDEISQDHDFSPGFIIWIPEEDEDKYGFRLSTAYDKLPKEFMGYPVEHRSRMGDGRKGVKTVEGFCRQFLGMSHAPENWREWMRIPSWALDQATNGEIWHDGLGRFSAVRETLLHGMPEDVRLKKLAAAAALMAQTGQYNYPRCMKHGEKGAAAIAVSEFAKQTVSLAYLLNRQHMPYYKWMFRGMEKLPVLSELKKPLENLFVMDGHTEEKIEEISAVCIDALKGQGLTDGGWDYLEPHAMEIQRRIKDPEIRALHLMEGGGASW